jgi:hypothetical protein
MATVMYLVINVLPCILHLKNKVGLKVMTRLLQIRMLNAKEGLIDGLGDSETNQIKNYLLKVEAICCTLIWGTDVMPVTWTCPYDAKEKTGGTLCLDNEKTRSIIGSIKLLVKLCIPAAERDI